MNLSETVICAAHPADTFTAETAQLLREVSGQPAICLNPPALDGSPGAPPPSLERIVDDLEALRQAQGGPRWVFWGLSGGGWLGQLWAHRHPQALAGLILESVCGCFRERLADPSCALSPFFPAWGSALSAPGLLAEDSHARPLADDVATEWTEVAGIGPVFRQRGGPALLVSPMPQPPAMLQMMPVFYRFDGRPWLPTLHLPTLVIAGSANPVVPVAQARALHQAIPGSAFVTIDGAGHVPTSQRHPEVGTAVRRFLAAVATG